VLNAHRAKLLPARPISLLERASKLVGNEVVTQTWPAIGREVVLGLVNL
jgi:hypothetical protein